MTYGLRVGYRTFNNCTFLELESIDVRLCDISVTMATGLIAQQQQQQQHQQPETRLVTCSETNVSPVHCYSNDRAEIMQ